jgi:hypothetical protein
MTAGQKPKATTLQQPSKLSTPPRKGIFMDNGMLMTSATCDSEEMKRGKEYMLMIRREGSLKAYKEIASGANLVANIRLQANSNRSLGNMNLKAEAESAMRRGHYRDAVRCLTLAIDKLEIKKSIFSITNSGSDDDRKSVVMSVIQLYRRRVWCQMKACERARITDATKLKNLTSIVQDCALLLRTGLFSEEIQPGSQIYNELSEIEAIAVSTKG